MNSFLSKSYYLVYFILPTGIHGNPIRSGLLKSLDKFDAGFFGLSPGMADTTDPGLRMLLEVCYEAIVDSGECITKTHGYVVSKTTFLCYFILYKTYFLRIWL